MHIFLPLLPPALVLLLWFYRSPKVRITAILILAALFYFGLSAIKEAPRNAPGLYFERNPGASGEVLQAQEQLSFMIHEMQDRASPIVTTSFFSLAAIALLYGRKGKDKAEDGK